MPAPMSKQDEAKAERQLKVFKLFAQLAQLPVKTIRQEAPDIFCALRSGEKVTYELVTLDSEQSSQTWGDFHSMPGAWSRALKSLPADRRRLYFRNFKHASIRVQYGVRPDRDERGGRMAQIIDKLLEQPAGFVGSLHFLRGGRVLVGGHRLI